MQESTRVIFVCLGNICRSPLAAGVFRRLVDEAGLTSHFEIDSAGTGHWNVGRSPHPQSRQVAADHGLHLAGTARQLQRDELDQWDHIIVMDQRNYDDVMAMAPTKAKVALLRDYDPAGTGIVPDPYGHGNQAYEEAYTLILRSCQGLLTSLNRA